MNGPPVVMRPSWIAAGQWWVLAMAAAPASVFLIPLFKANPNLPPWWYVPLIVGIGVPALALRHWFRLVRRITLAPEGLEVEFRDGSHAFRWEEVTRVDYWSWWFGSEIWEFHFAGKGRIRLDTTGLSGQDQGILREEFLQLGPKVVEHRWWESRV